MDGPSHYAILGLERGCSAAALRKRYRALALKWHPDRNRGDEANATEKFKAILEAFEVLSDVLARQQYDAELARARARGACSTPRGAVPPRPPPPPRDVARDVKTAKAMADAMQSDEWLQKLRKRAAEAAAAAEAAEAAEAADADCDMEAEADEEDEEAAIAEALAAVEEAMRREQEELEAALRAVEAAEQSPRGTRDDQLITAELQLKALMELGFHAEVALPLCDGVSTIEEIVETLMG